MPAKIPRGAALRWSAVGLAIGVNFGNAGPIANDLAASFGSSLGEIGLVTTALLIAHAASQLPAAGPIERYGPRRVATVALIVLTLVNLLAAAVPGLTGLIALRLLAGLATGPAFVAGLEGGRQEGGPFLAGIFGGAGTLGIAIALAAGTLLEDAGASWRASFVLASGVALLALVLLWSGGPKIAHVERHRDPPRLREVARNPAIWRLALLHTATFGSSLIVGAWIVEYLARDGGPGRGLGGAIGALLMVLTAIGRPAGGLIVQRREAWGAIAVGGALLAAAGLAVLAIAREPLVAIPASIIVGVGFALPFAAVFQAAVRAEPARAASATAMVNLFGAVFALIAAPLVGYDLDGGSGSLSFGLLAVLALVAAVVNRRPPGATSPDPRPS